MALQLGSFSDQVVSICYSMASTTLIQIQNAEKSFGNHRLFSKAQLAINEGEHIGVIGPNGAGKTTLFKILANQEELDSGEVTRSKHLRLGYLEQESEWPLHKKVETYLEENSNLPLWTVKQWGLDLGLTETHFNNEIRELSGGFRMRVKLLSLLSQEPELLLLDEPTNFLDLETLLVLESFLQNLKSSFMIISHDREFLRRVTDHIVEVEGGDITKFAGNLDDYFEQKQQLQELKLKQIESQEARAKSILDFVSRFGAKATKARQAQSKLKLLEKMEKIEIKKAPVTSHIALPPPLAAGKIILEVDNISCGYGSKKVLEKVNLRLERGHHLGLVGHNGAGKSTLLKTLAQEIPPLDGDLKFGHQVSWAYFAQHTPEKLRPEDTVLESLQSAAHASCLAQEILNMAGSLLFGGDRAHKKIKFLSGGEKSRVALGQVLLKKANLLILDEPTNHLDFETVECLTQALEQYEGSLIVVSHDRGFIARIASQILEVESGKLRLYPGTYDEYLWSLQKGVLSTLHLENTNSVGPIKTKGTTNSNEKADSQRVEKFNYRDEMKKRETSLKKTQKEILEIESKIFELTRKRDELNHELLMSQGEQAAQKAQELHQVSAQIEEKELILLEKMELENSLQVEIDQLKVSATQ